MLKRHANFRLFVFLNIYAFVSILVILYLNLALMEVINSLKEGHFNELNLEATSIKFLKTEASIGLLLGSVTWLIYKFGVK